MFGPTAVGKTGVLPLFSETCEVINADSMQVYKYMDIGTAKPSKNILEMIPHHLIDIIEPDVQFNAGIFVEKADLLCTEIIQRKKIPVISGGTAFYFNNFILGLPETPPSQAETRKAIISKYKKTGIESLWHELNNLDPVTAEKLSVNDKQRIIRALEVYEISGRKLSSYETGKGRFDKYDFCIIGLSEERGKLYEIINRRVSEMMHSGLVEEVRKLLTMGFSFDDPGMKGIGYREFRDCKDFSTSALGKIEDEIAKNTRRYAKRQMTFFKKIPGTYWIDRNDKVLLKETFMNFIEQNSQYL